MKKIKRRKFFGSSLGLIGISGLDIPEYVISGKKINESAKSQELVRLKGKKDKRIKRWDIITIGNLSRNRYWGESDERAIRSVICTCTVIRVEDFHVLVDPSIENEQIMAAELNRRMGLTPDDIDVVFITHQHGDHHVGLPNFPKAKWLAGAEVATGLNKTGLYSKPVEPADHSIYDAIEVIPTPGHTADHKGLRFDCEGFSVFIAGDSVATRDFWVESQMFYVVSDLEEATRTLKKIASIADIVVPGHDNYFFSFE
jgi:glyoxylase-like metal-dependent hydrolase (beta-lactamase superfamily II)